jgi:hypothetical protein
LHCKQLEEVRSEQLLHVLVSLSKSKVEGHSQTDDTMLNVELKQVRQVEVEEQVLQTGMQERQLVESRK